MVRLELISKCGLQKKGNSPQPLLQTGVVLTQGKPTALSDPAGLALSRGYATFPSLQSGTALHPVAHKTGGSLTGGSWELALGKGKGWLFSLGLKGREKTCKAQGQFGE